MTPSPGTSIRIVATYITILDRKRVFQTRLHHFEQLRVILVVADVVEDVSIGDDVERSEDYYDGNVGSNVGYRRLDRLTRLHGSKKRYEGNPQVTQLGAKRLVPVALSVSSS